MLHRFLVYELDVCFGTYVASSEDDAIRQHKAKYGIVGDAPLYAEQV